MSDERMSLDVDAPDKIVGVLRHTADKYRESASELRSAWQDKNAGAGWDLAASYLERAADSLAKRIP